MRLVLFLPLFLGLCFPLQAQEKLNIQKSCSYTGELDNSELYGFNSDTEAEDALSRIMKYTGLPSNFTIKAANVPNAAAVIQGEDRFILYNQYFMLRVKDLTKTDWAALSILAHEIGHHLSGHTLDNLGSRPDKELEADKFSGFVLYKMGATLEEARVAMDKLAGESGSATHPPRSARLAAITNGWLEAKELSPDIRPINKPTNKPSTTKPKTTTTTSKKPTATYEKTWVDYDVYEDGKKGMRIHAKFNINNLKGQKCRAVAWFYYNDGEKLEDKNSKFNTSDGQVSVGQEFTPLYTNTDFNDLEIFMPYEELHLTTGKHKLKFKIGLFEDASSGFNKVGANSEYYYFDYDAGSAPPPTSEFYEITVDHNVYEGGEKGMEIHLTFNIGNLKGEKCRAVAWFYTQSGTALSDYNNKYNTTDDKVSTGTDFVPLYESTKFNDLSLFLPYDELHLGSGYHNLKFDVGLFHNSSSGYKQVGTTSNSVEFYYTK